MSDATPSGKPGVLRQEGPHRVTVAPGATSALAPSVGPAAPRLRPAVGALRPAVPAGDESASAREGSLRQRAAGVSGSVTQVQRLPGRSAIHGAFAPEGNGSSSGQPSAAASALEQRLSALAELNSNTTKTVTTFELGVGQVERSSSSAQTGEHTSPDKPKRSLFKRRTP